MRPLLIRGGRVIDPSRNLDEVADLLIQDGAVAGVGRGLGAPDGAETLDAKGLVVAPGLVDVHTHLREPGQEDRETIATGAAAASPPSAPCPTPTRPSTTSRPWDSW